MRIITGSNNMEVAGKTIKGISFNWYVQHASVATAFAALPINLENVNIMCSVMYPNGKVIEVANTNLRVLMAMSGFGNRNFHFARRAFFNAAFQVNPYRYVVQDVAVAEILQIPMSFEFPNPVNLTKGLRMKLDVTVTTAAYAATVNQSTSYVEINEIDSDGNSPYIPVFKSWTVEQGSSQFSQPLGNHIRGAYFLNFDKTGVLLTDQIINNVALASDKLTVTKQYNQLLADRERYFQEAQTGNTSSTSLSGNNSFYGQSFPLYLSDAALLNKVNANISMNSSNVASGVNFVAIVQQYTDRDLYTRYQIAEKQHAQENARWLV